MGKVVTVELKAKTGKVKSDLQGVNKELGKTKDNFSEVGNVADKATGGAVSKFKALKGTLKGVTGGFKTLRGAIISTGIGALVIAVTSLIAAFKSSEEGQNKFQKILGVIGVVVGNLTDKLSDLGEFIIGVFENPKQALKDFGQLLKDQLINRFTGMLELIPNLGKAIGLLFKGQFREAGKVAANAVGKVVLGVENVTDRIEDAIDATKEFISEQQREIEVAKQIADARAKANKQERELLVERAKANRDVAELREQAADKENKTVQERIAALIKAGEIEQNITNKEIENARLRFEAKQAENALSKSTKEDLDEEARLLTTLTDLETARLRKQKALTAELTTARREANAELENERKAFLDLNQQIDEAIAVSEEQKRELELTKIREHYTQLIIAARDNGLDFNNLRDAQRAALAAKQAEWDQKDLEAKKKLTEAEVTLEKQKQDEKYKTLNSAIEIAGKESKLGKALFLAKQALAIKEIIMNAQSTLTKASLNAAEASSALATGTAQTAKIGFPQNIPMLIGYAAQAVGIFSAIKSATSKAKNVASGFGGGGGTSFTPEGISVSKQIPKINTTSFQPNPPQIETVGSSGINQLAETISIQNNKPNEVLDKIVETLKSNNDKPIKAYVVSKDISTAQEMDRNVVNGASI